MIKNQKYIFLYALIATLIVFNVGIFMGYLMETSRVDKINDLALKVELQLLDQTAQRDAMKLLDLDCELLIEGNIKFGDKIFEQALEIEKYEKANQINEEITFQHKRFDLLRTLFWMNSVEIKQKCKSDYHNIIYFYDYDNPSIEQNSKQRFFSNLLGEVKELQGNNIMLIPLAADNDISSINLLLKQYNITELPTILIDEKVKLTEINSISEVEKYLD
jgi:hypothetical protein